MGADQTAGYTRLRCGGLARTKQHPIDTTPPLVTDVREQALSTTDDLVRISIGAEDTDDRTADRKQALAAVRLSRQGRSRASWNAPRPGLVTEHVSSEAVSAAVERKGERNLVACRTEEAARDLPRAATRTGDRAGYQR